MRSGYSKRRNFGRDILPIDKRWSALSAEDWKAFAEAWLAELRSADGEASDYGQRVVLMNFTATPEQQWQFIVAATECASSDPDLGHIAAGPIEHLVGWHGEEFIDRIEQRAGEDPQFARALTGVWQYKMSDELWARIRAIQESVSNPLQLE